MLPAPVCEALIHRDGAARGGLDACRLETEAGDVGLPPGGEQHLVRLDGLAGLGRNLDRRAVAGEGGRIGVEAEVDPALAHLLAEHFAQVVVEAAQRQVAPVELGHVRAKALHDAGELAGDVTAAHDHDALGQRGQVEHLVRADGELDAGDIGHGGPAAGGDHDGLGAVRLVADGDGLGVEQAAGAADMRGSGVVQQSLVDALQAVELGRFGSHHRRPVEGGLAHGPAVARGVFEVVAEVRGVDQELLRDAAAVDAGAAEPVVLDHRGLGAIARRTAGAGHTARAATDHKEIEVRHPFAPIRARVRCGAYTLSRQIAPAGRELVGPAGLEPATTPL